LLLLSGCGEKKRARVHVPPAPEVAAQPSQSAPQEIEVAPNAKPILIEIGLASWYGPPYHNRRGANGQVYDMNAMTAAHRTLPLNSVVRVVNLSNDKSTLVRITDRGPFVDGRVVDLSLAAAKEIDVWRKGTAKVRLEVLETPASLEKGGRWCVQIGAFAEEDEALKLKSKLARRYKTAKVLSFGSPVGDYWVRVRVLGDDKRRAEEVLKENSTPEGTMFLVRLD
jgi:rare lipoprotein A